MVQRAGSLGIAFWKTHDAMLKGILALDSVNDFQNRNLRRRPRKGIAPTRPAVRQEESTLNQGLKYLSREKFRYIQSLAHVFGLKAFTFFAYTHVSKCQNGVLAAF